MQKIKCITFDKKAQDSLPEHIKSKMKADREKAEKQHENNADIRKIALTWWNSMNLESKFYKTIKHNELIEGDRTRHPDTLTGREIEIIYNADK